MPLPAPLNGRIAAWKTLKFKNLKERDLEYRLTAYAISVLERVTDSRKNWRTV